MALKLVPFQIKGVRKIEHFRGRVLLADDMGLGKSPTAIGWWMAHPEIKRVLVYCPANLKWHWQDQFAEHAGVRCDVLDGRKPRTRQPLVSAKVLIINYDIAQYWRKYLKNFKPQLVIIDEDQYIRSPDRQVGRKQSMYSIRTKSVRSVCRGVPHILALGGTGALENRPAEMFAILNIIRPDLFPSFFEFAIRYCCPQRKPWGWEYKGATRLGELHKILKENLMIRRRKEDVLDDLPKRTRVVLPMRDLSLKEYKELEGDMKQWARKAGIQKRKMKGDERAEAMLKVGYMLRLCAKLKIQSVIKWVDDFLENSDEKIILFAIHKFVIKDLREHFGKQAVVIDGSTPKQYRKPLTKKFNTDKSCRVLIGQLKAAGIGWSAKECANTGTVEYWWNPAVHTQADDRVFGMYRGHAGRPVFNYYFTARGTIEERLCALLQKKQADIDAVLDGGKASNFNLLDQLIKEVVGAKQ